MSNDVVITVRTKDKTDVDGIAKKSKEKFGKAGDESGKSFGSGIKKWFTGSGGGLFSEIGKSGGTVFGSGFLGAIKTPILGPAIAAILGGAILTFLPAVGAVAGAGLVTGIGAGLAGLGIMFAAKSDRIKRIWTGTLTGMGNDMQLISRPFEQTLVVIAGTFRRTFGEFRPYLARAFASMAGPVSSFVDQLGRAFEGFIPAIQPITTAFNAVLGQLGPALRTMISQISDALTDLANSVAKNPTALADFARGIGSLVAEALGLITVLNNINSAFENLTGGLSLVDIAMGMVTGSITLLKGLFSGVLAVIEGVAKVLGKDGLAKDAEDAQNALKYTGDAAKYASPPVEDLAKKTKDSAKAAADAKKKFEDWITSLFRFQNLALNLSAAQIGLQQAIDDATKSVKDNGRTLDINTAKGRANRNALNAIAKSANEQTEAMIRSGEGNRAAANAAESARKRFITQAVQMGANKKTAEAWARSMIAIPNVTREAKLRGDIGDLNTKLASARAQLNDKNLTRARRAQIQANIADLLAKKRQALAALAALPSSKTINIYSNRYETTIRRQTTSGGGHAPGTFRVGGLSHAAEGGPRGNLTMTGEDGPELAFLPTGTKVMPASNTQNMLSQGSDKPIIIKFDVGRADELGRAMFEWFRKQIKVEGGNVQFVLGPS